MTERWTAAALLLLFIAAHVKGFPVTVIQSSKLLSQRRAMREDKETKGTSGVDGPTPQLIVFDLDNTLWTPELYTLRAIQRANKVPVAGKDVKLFPGAQAILELKKTGELSADVKFAIASRTKSVAWAHDLLQQFGIRNLFDIVEIFPGSKVTHFTNIQASSGISFADMMFFDDARDGQYGNCVPVADMGVLTVHCPNGLTDVSIFKNALSRFREWDGSKGTIVEFDGSVSTSKQASASTTNKEGRQSGTIKSINIEKRYGFIRCKDNSAKDLFFHFSALPKNNRRVEVGDAVDFMVEIDSKTAKSAAVEIQVSPKSDSASSGNGGDAVTMRAFSMNMPFAALLANGYKTLETRNGTMFVPYPEGTTMLLHVGQRTYPDANRHLEIMKSGGLTDDQIEELKSLPKGFGRGMVVAVCEIGRTYETTVAERSLPDVQRKVGAYGEDSGRMVTEIKRVQYLKRPVVVAAKGGVFDVQIDPALLPDGWSTAPVASEASTDAKMGKPMYSISG